MTTLAALSAPVERLTRAGFDAVVAFDTERFNRTTSEGDFCLPDFGRARALALVIGNSRALWAPFITALERDPELEHALHPLDTYTEAAVAALQAGVTMASTALFSHRGEPRVPIQRIAASAGLAELSPSHLSVHPVYGPWLGLRAVVVFDAPFPAEPDPHSNPRRVGSPARAVLAGAPAADPKSHCRGCAAPCLEAFERARSTQGDVRDERLWRGWLAVRDACPVARAHRYGPNQIRYHYTKDRRALRPEPA